MSTGVVLLAPLPQLREQLRLSFEEVVAGEEDAQLLDEFVRLERGDLELIVRAELAYGCAQRCIEVREGIRRVR